MAGAMPYAENSGTDRPLMIARNTHIQADSTFRDGFHSGWLEYWLAYKEARITDETITQFISKNSHDQRAPALWNAGYIAGWLASVFSPDPSVWDDWEDQAS